MKLAEYKEEDRIEHIHGFSHCRCRNKILDSGKQSCPHYKETISMKHRKRDLPEDQQCHHNTNTGYCQLSRLDEVSLIKKTEPKNLHLITDRIVTEKGLKLLKNYGLL